MPKLEREFSDAGELPWAAVADSASGGAGGPGIEQKILSADPATGDLTRLLRWAPGVRTAETIAHDFWEEVFTSASVRRSPPACTPAGRPA